MPAENPWFKCYPRLFLDGVDEIPLEEIGLYAVIMMRIYDAEEPLPYDFRKIGALGNVGPRKAREIVLKLIGRGKLILTNDGRISNRKCEEVLAERRGLSAVRSHAASGPKPRRKVGHNSDSSSDITPTSRGDNVRLAEQEMAENSHSDEAIALQKPLYTRARAFAQDEEIQKEEKKKTSPLTPPRSDRTVDGEDFGNRGEGEAPRERTDAERAQLMLDVSNLSKKLHDFGDVDIQALTGWIMAEAKMVVPPMDLGLVGSWLRFGVDEYDIRQTVTGLAASARSPIRMMRYFDQSVRAIRAAETAKDEKWEREMAAAERRLAE